MSDHNEKTFSLSRRNGLGLVIVGTICVLPFTVATWQSKAITLELGCHLLFGSMLISAGGYSFFKSRNQAQKGQS